MQFYRDVLIRHIFRQDATQSGSPNAGEKLVSLNLSVVDVMQMYLFNVKVEVANDVIHVYKIAVCVVRFYYFLPFFLTIFIYKRKICFR